MIYAIIDITSWLFWVITFICVAVIAHMIGWDIFFSDVGVWFAITLAYVQRR